MRFTDPIFLLLLPLLIAGIVWSSRRLMGISQGRKRFVVLLRCFIAAQLTLALAGWQTIRQNQDMCVVFLLDKSDSVPEESRKRAEKFISESLKNLPDDAQAAVIGFGRNPVIDLSPTHTRTLPPLYSDPNRQGTDLSSAIRLASALFPDGYSKRILLLSDGNETEGDSLQSASVAATDRIEIDTIPLASVAPEREVIVSEINTPNEVKIGEPFDLRVVIEASKPASGLLRVDQDGAPVKQVSVDLTTGKNVVLIPVQTSKAGFYRYRVVLEAQPDTDPRNNIGRGFVSVRGKPRALLAEGQPDPSRALERALQSREMEVVKANPSTFPSRPDELQNYDVILFHDFPAFGLSAEQMKAVQSATRDTGIGFAMIGGEQSFLPGGYFETPIAEMLPVDLEVRQRKVYPAATVIVVIDISGSMAMQEGGVQKVHLAGQAAIQTLKMLRPMDRFGVIVSGTGCDWLSPVQPAANKERAISQISKIFAGGGGIYVRPSLEFAQRAFLAENTRVKHLIVLADGDDADDQEGCFQLAQSLLAQGVTMSVVSLGQGKDVPFLKQLARSGRGNFYLTDRARDLPKMFTADVSLMTRSAIEEGAFVPKIASNDDVLKGIDWNSAPPLLAYDLTSDRPMARTLLRTHKEDPLLAVWQYGLGTSIAFTSDAKPKWAQRWMGWSDFNTFWAQLTRSALRKAGRLNYQLLTRREGGQAVVDLQAFDAEGNPINFLQPDLQISSPTGQGFALTLQQSAPGRYQGRFDIAEFGDYLLTMKEKQPDGSVRVTTTGFSMAYPPEYRFTRANANLLKRISEMTGGKFEPAASEIFRPISRPNTSASDLWRVCLLSALVLFLLETTVRRVALPLGQAFALLGSVFKRIGRSGREPSAQPAAGVSAQLLQAKSRARSTQATDSPVNPAPSLSRKEPAEPTLLESPEPTEAAAKPTVAPGSATQRLLEKKRRREG